MVITIVILTGKEKRINSCDYTKDSQNPKKYCNERTMLEKSHFLTSVYMCIYTNTYVYKTIYVCVHNHIKK
jgi:hypothetical protein